MSASRQSSDKRSKVYGIMGTVMLHVAVLALLWAVKINATETPDDDEGGGIYVMAGMGGSEWNYTETVPANELESGIEENITQDLEESINIDNSDKERHLMNNVVRYLKRWKICCFKCFCCILFLIIHVSPPCINQRQHKTSHAPEGDATITNNSRDARRLSHHLCCPAEAGKRRARFSSTFA